MGRASVLIYGRTKIGKTTDACYATRKLPVFVLETEPDALEPVVANFGFKPPSYTLVTPANPLIDMQQALLGPVTDAVLRQGAQVLIWDSLTAFCVRLFNTMMMQLKDGRRVYSLIRPAVLDLVSTFLSIPAAIHIATAHEVSPKENDYGMQRGGPKLEDRVLTEAVPGLFRLVMRADVDSKKRIYRCNGLDPLWVMGDGYGATLDKQPMDLRPILWRIMYGDAPIPAALLEPKPYRRPKVESA